jgi:hypothetical protein
MASERQRQANRRNGSKGGPKTEAGKERSRGNSLKHGLSSSTLVVLPDEHEHEYEAILRGFRDSFQPQDAAEEALVLRLAHAQWRSLRSRRVETGILHITAATERNRARKIVENCPEHLSPHNAIAVGFMTGPEERWQMYLRYDGAISREFFRTLDTLTRLQKARQRKKPSKEPVIAAAAGAMSDFGIRSVSQISAAPANLTEGKELTHESKAHKNITRRASGSARRPAQAAQSTPDSIGRKERHVRRLSATARVLPRNQRRASERNHHPLGRRRHPLNRAAGLKKHRSLSSPPDHRLEECSFEVDTRHWAVDEPPTRLHYSDCARASESRVNP